MSEQERLEVAKKYVDKQLETMKEQGSAPKDISDSEYKALIAQVAETVRT